MSVPTKKPTTKLLDWGALVRQAWGDDYHKPEIAYEFEQANKVKREFHDSGRHGGPYTGTSGN